MLQKIVSSDHVPISYSHYFFWIESVAGRTKVILTTLRSRRARGEQVALTQIIAADQLRVREKLMRQPKPTQQQQQQMEKNVGIFSC